MAPPLLLLQDINTTLGTQALLDGASIGVSAGERICLVGRNGSGKSTLLKIAAGMLRPDGGTRFVQPGTTMRYLPQEPDLSGFATTLDYVQDGLGPSDDEHRGPALLDRLGLTGYESPANLSGGEARRAALARALAPSPDLLLLDEPTNHLDLPAIEWLEKELASLRAGIVLISHDRRMLQNVGRSVIWLEGGITRRMDRGFEHFEAWREEVAEQEARDRQKLNRQIVREEHWITYGVTARRKRNVRRVAELAALRQKRREAGGPGNTLKLAAADGEVSGKQVVVAEHASKSYGERPIVKDLSLRVLRGDRLGIVGPNGAGKTTLLRLMTGLDEPDTGSMVLGTNLQPVTLDQQRAALDPATTLQDTLTGGDGDQVTVAGQKRHVVGYMKDFLFQPEQARTPVGMLSGGERGRLLLACALARPSNLLILDEPTNDLDLETLDLLQELLADYSGTVLLVSHDRDFLDRVVTSTLASEGAGQWTEYAGGYSDMLLQRGPTEAETVRQAAKAAKPRTGTRAPKMSFKDKLALESLPAEIGKLEHRVRALQTELADPDLYRRRVTRFKEATAALAAAQAELAKSEERWLELEAMREMMATNDQA
ncbi:ABC-F family ATP-binding cassette domain-containing protein [Acidisphaera sp. L21]|uniref:ABC-F family ATP-binding cassette domain-containing protein n=1 Tax=Acidisphaera sp. L21 TaxID=1641851 RepID=UPI00131A7566|nr:ABC-F family ATP-binding cassette domain-containing protein [Acidisphaera sp. L21]